MPGVHKIIKQTLKILWDLLQNFKHMFGHFVDARYYRVKINVTIM